MAEVLQGLSNDLAAVVASASASIVRVEARRRLPATGIIWNADGLIVTSHHVVERDENITVGLPDGSTVAATLVGRDPTTDIAVLRVQTSGLTPARWAETNGVQVGHLVLALGRPEKSVQAALGIISALGEGWRTSAGGRIDAYIQTDLVMYPGFSGGPLVAADGAFIGLNTSALMRDTSVALPGSTLRRVVDTLHMHGRVRRGYLGVSAQPVRLPDAIAQAAGQETGLMLMSVESGSPADKSGMTLGDTLVMLDSQPIRHMDDLLGLLSGERVGQPVPAKIVRGGQLQDLSVMIGERE